MKKEQLPSESLETEGPWKGEKTFEHPAFGMVTVARWTSGGRGHRLFGSDLAHNVGLTIKVKLAGMKRGHSCDRIYEKERLIEINMSEAQWSRFVSSIGNGDGLPVTLSAYRTGDLLDAPSIAAPDLSRKELHGEEMKERLQSALREAAAEVDALGTMLDEGKITKTALREMHGRLQRAIGYAPGNIKFAYDMFAERLESTVEDAKTEFEAHVGAVADRLGMEQLRQLGMQLIGGTHVAADIDAHPAGE
jgi:hypothetical protein